MSMGDWEMQQDIERDLAKQKALARTKNDTYPFVERDGVKYGFTWSWVRNYLSYYDRFPESFYKVIIADVQFTHHMSDLRIDEAKLPVAVIGDTQMSAGGNTTLKVEPEFFDHAHIDVPIPYHSDRSINLRLPHGAETLLHCEGASILVKIDQEQPKYMLLKDVYNRYVLHKASVRIKDFTIQCFYGSPAILKR